MKQQTINAPVSIEGRGLHTGAISKITILPADINHGIKFKRIDIENMPILNADAAKVSATTRGTVIKSGEHSVSTIEHLLSALIANQIDNVLVEISGPEVPILDGSALPFVELLETAGIHTQDADASVVCIETPQYFHDEISGATYIALPSETFEATVVVDYPSKYIGHQSATFNTETDYKTTISPARTFVMLNEIMPLIEQGLIKGGDIDNALIFANDDTNATVIEKIAEKLNKSSISINEQGVLNVSSLRFPNEPARHKLLDLIGDLGLAGKRIKGKIIATKPGHTGNVEFAKFLKRYHQEQQKGIPVYNPNEKPIYDVVEISKRLPHRYPFLLLDKIIELSEKHVVGIKNVTFNEGFFQGHFPNNPVMPGVLQIEAMAQIGGILALSTVPDPGNWDTYFLKIDETKFKQKVVPGDTIIFKLELAEPIRRGIVVMNGAAYVGNKLVSEAHLTAQIVRRTTNEATAV
jgi:UDP-3-O-[3-hydroxymyristoyl] N-acetylglucosamine deacetylase / 3-hydroxyacyl-[acyl-carrier-protein] dehydratase